MYSFLEHVEQNKIYCKLGKIIDSSLTTLALYTVYILLIITRLI